MSLFKKNFFKKSLNRTYNPTTSQTKHTKCSLSSVALQERKKGRFHNTVLLYFAISTSDQLVHFLSLTLIALRLGFACAHCVCFV